MTKSERTVLVLQGGSALGADEHQKTFTWGANVLTRNKPALWMLTWRGRKIDLGAIRRTALLTIEGERDDICSLGQTLAAHDLCTGLRPCLKTHYVQAGAGHYGVFSGKRWSAGIYPVVREAIQLAQ